MVLTRHLAGKIWKSIYMQDIVKPGLYYSLRKQFIQVFVLDQVYSNTPVLTRVNTSQHESTRV